MFGTSSWEATPFRRIAEEPNWRIADSRCFPAIERTVTAKGQSRLAMLSNSLQEEVAARLEEYIRSNGDLFVEIARRYIITCTCFKFPVPFNAKPLWEW